MGRFINADAFVATGQGLLGNNMFAYCNNNSINYYDPSGQYLASVSTGAMGESFGGSSWGRSTGTGVSIPNTPISADTKGNVTKRVIEQVDSGVTFVKENWKDIIDVTITTTGFISAAKALIKTPTKIGKIVAFGIATWSLGRQFNWW